MLWVDSICINQSIVPERNRQPGLMTNIYQNAAQVLIYLGESHDDGDSVMSWIRELDSPSNFGDGNSSRLSLATNPRDKIYAILPLVKAEYEKSMQNLLLSSSSATNTSTTTVPKEIPTGIQVDYAAYTEPPETHGWENYSNISETEQKSWTVSHQPTGSDTNTGTEPGPGLRPALHIHVAVHVGNIIKAGPICSIADNFLPVKEWSLLVDDDGDDVAGDRLPVESLVIF